MRNPVHTTLPQVQRGAAALAVTLALLAAMLLTLLAANRNLLLELRQSSNQASSAVAFEVAEAGLDWTLARLNDDSRVGDTCQPAPLATQSFRERHLDMASAALTPRALRPACARTASGWACSCPADASASPHGDGTAFAVQVEPGPQSGQLRLRAIGCERFEGACRPDGSGRELATERHEALLALQPALARPPATALTMRPTDVTTDAFFASLFGLSKAQWKRQPAVTSLDCRGDCGAALAALAERGTTLVALPGDLTLRGPLSLGTAERPMLIVADGAVRLQGAVQLHGMLYGAGIAWAAPAAIVRGALISEGEAAGDGSLDLARDAEVLDALHTRQGSFVRLPGGWRDF